MINSTEEAKKWKEIALESEKEIYRLQESLHKFLDKNFQGGSKSDREDYTCFVSCKDVHDLYKSYKEIEIHKERIEDKIGSFEIEKALDGIKEIFEESLKGYSVAQRKRIAEELINNHRKGIDN